MFKVGHESASRFAREYGRMFAVSPARTVRAESRPRSAQPDTYLRRSRTRSKLFVGTAGAADFHQVARALRPEAGALSRARALFDRAEVRLPEIEEAWHDPVYPDPWMYQQMRTEAAALLGIRPPRGG